MDTKVKEIKTKNTILQTAEAFKAIIDNQSLSNSDSNPLEVNIFKKDNSKSKIYKALSVLVYGRKTLREITLTTKFKDVSISLIEDDCFGWPRFVLRAEMNQRNLTELTIGAQSRRDGITIFFKENCKDTLVELNYTQYEDIVEFEKSLRSIVRIFFESVSIKLRELNSIDKCVAEALDFIQEDLSINKDIMLSSKNNYTNNDSRILDEKNNSIKNEYDQDLNLDSYDFFND